MRILGLDYGTKTVGVAVSDPLKMTAQPLETIERKSANKLRQTLARIEAILEEYGAAGERDRIELIVLGYPKNMNNSEQDLRLFCGMSALPLWRQSGSLWTAE